jgi:hypothetical protein
MTDPIQAKASEPFEPAPPTQPLSNAPLKPARRGSGMWINVALGLALVVALGGVAFAAGRMTAPPAAAGFTGANGRTFQGGYFPGGGNGGTGGAGRGVFGGGGAAIQGTVTAVTADSITITTTTGQTIQVPLNSTTTYHQQAVASSSDVKTGGTVIVRLGLGGQTGAEGPTSRAATDVTIVP